MTNNDILRRLRYTFNFNDKKMVAIFASANFNVTREQVAQWLKKEDDPDYVNCTDQQLAAFLNGFINEKRGKRAEAQLQPEKKITNNVILTKLKIALNLRAEDIIDLLQTVNFRIGKAELSAFFRKPEHKHYRQCKDQFLRNFLKAIQDKYYIERSKKVEFNHSNSIKNKPSVANTPLSQNNAKVIKSKAVKEKQVYINPKFAKQEVKQECKQKDKQSLSTRKTLTLSPEEIWKN